MKKNARASWVQGVAVVSLSASAAMAQTPFVVYDNTESPLNSYFASQREFGDQVSLGTPGLYATAFRFEYFASGLSGGEKATVRFYANNGVPTGAADALAPGQLLFESTEFDLVNGNIPVSVTDLQSLDVQLPESFTWTVRMTGVEGGEIFGLKLYDPPVNNPAAGTVGTSLNDIWRFGTDGWELLEIPGLAVGQNANFGAYLEVVPEPGAGVLFALGGLALALRRRSNRR